MEGIFEPLICSNCTKYLSVFPIKVYPNRSVKCGRCNSKDDGGAVSKLYQTLVENLKFPCVNCYEGCKELLPPNEMKVHEVCCVGTTIQCPICCKFKGQSFSVVQHFKQKHYDALLRNREFVIVFNDKNEDMSYLYASFLENKLDLVRVRYDNVMKELYLDIAPIYRESLRGKHLLQKFILYTVHNKIIYKSYEKKCATYNSNRGFILNNDNIGISMTGDYPRGVAICKFFIEEAVTERDLQHSFGHLLSTLNIEQNAKIIFKEVPKEVIKYVPIPCSKNHFASEPVVQVRPCQLQHVIDNPVMPPNVMNSGEQNIRFNVNNIRTLISVYSPLFYVGNTTWKILLKKNFIESTPYLSCFVEKIDDSSENHWSYKIMATIYVLSGDSEYTVSESFPEKIIGKRSNEVMNWGWDKFMLWSTLLDQNKKYIFFNDTIQIKIEMTLIKILPHKLSCRCNDCR